MNEERVPVEQEDLMDLLRNSSELYVQNANVDGNTGKVYEVIAREPGKIEGFYLGDLVEATFQHRGCGCGPDVTAEGDYLVQTGRISGAPGFALGGPATKYDLATNTTSGDTHEIFLYFEEKPSEKVRTTIMNS
jgi:hypothetical protein